MARMRTTLVAAAATIAALAAPTTALAEETSTSCDGLSSSLNNATTGDVVILVDDEPCVGHFNLPEGESITFKGGEGLATLSGDLGDGDRTQILSGHDTAGTIIEGLTFIDGLADRGDGGAIRLTGDSAVTLAEQHLPPQRRGCGRRRGLHRLRGRAPDREPGPDARRREPDHPQRQHVRRGRGGGR